MSVAVNNEKRPINWQPIIELAIAAAMVIGTVVPLYVHTDGKLHIALTSIQDGMNQFQKDMRNDMKEFRQEMKEFHDEMKIIHGRMCIVEERQVNKTLNSKAAGT